jgi:hypothetical protein
VHSALLQRRPLLAQCATTAVLSGTGDVLAQQAVERKGAAHDVRASFPARVFIMLKGGRAVCTHGASGVLGRRAARTRRVPLVWRAAAPADSERACGDGGEGCARSGRVRAMCVFSLE